MNRLRDPGYREPSRIIVSWAIPALLLTLATGACERRRSDEAEPSNPPSAASESLSAAVSTVTTDGSQGRPAYRRTYVVGPAWLAGLRDSLGANGFRQVLKVNRIDLEHVRKGDSLVIPMRASVETESDGTNSSSARSRGSTSLPKIPQPGDSLFFSPFPKILEEQAALPKLLLISIRVQAFAAYNYGKLAQWGPTSTGRRESPTPEGLFHTNWKDKERTSTVNDEWLLTWYVNLDNVLGVSLHQYALPGRPASHSCVRLLEEDARWLYAWSEQWKLSPDGATVLQPGTPVVVFGSYAYGKRPPWTRLAKDPAAAAVPLSEVEETLRSYLKP
jgi:hypothetical protein